MTLYMYISSIPKPFCEAQKAIWLWQGISVCITSVHFTGRIHKTCKITDILGNLSTRLNDTGNAIGALLQEL